MGQPFKIRTLLFGRKFKQKQKEQKGGEQALLLYQEEVHTDAQAGPLVSKEPESGCVHGLGTKSKFCHLHTQIPFHTYILSWKPFLLSNLKVSMGKLKIFRSLYVSPLSPVFSGRGYWGQTMCKWLL